MKSTRERPSSTPWLPLPATAMTAGRYGSVSLSRAEKLFASSLSGTRQ